jgi:hypothetical protein
MKEWSVCWVERRCSIPADQTVHAIRKVRRGHNEHNDAETIDLHAELQDELADLVGYSALAHWRGQWNWRLWLVAWLSGIAWRVLGDRPIEPKGEGSH